MPRYRIERGFPAGLGLSPNPQGCGAAAGIKSSAARGGVIWLHAYMTLDKRPSSSTVTGSTEQARFHIARASQFRMHAANTRSEETRERYLRLAEAEEALAEEAERRS